MKLAARWNAGHSRAWFPPSIQIAGFSLSYVDAPIYNKIQKNLNIYKFFILLILKGVDPHDFYQSLVIVQLKDIHVQHLVKMIQNRSNHDNLNNNINL